MNCWEVLKLYLQKNLFLNKLNGYSVKTIKLDNQQLNFLKRKFNDYLARE